MYIHADCFLISMFFVTFTEFGFKGFLPPGELELVRGGGNDVVIIRLFGETLGVWAEF